MWAITFIPTGATLANMNGKFFILKRKRVNLLFSYEKDSAGYLRRMS